jgi:hypothetical protein
MTTVIMTTTTKATRDGKTKPLLIAATRRSCHAWCMGRRASTPPRSATRTPRTANINLKTKKRHYNAHHNNAHYTSDDDESHLSTDTLVPSEDPASASSKSEKTHEDENHHLHVAKKMKAGSHVPCKSDHWQQRTKSLSQKGKKGEIPPTFLENDLNVMDTILMGLDSMDADLDRPDDITNLFDFNLWWSMPVELFGIKNTENLETVLYKTSTNVELQKVMNRLAWKQ